jgi:hypothetical protein
MHCDGDTLSRFLRMPPNLAAALGETFIATYRLSKIRTAHRKSDDKFTSDRSDRRPVALKALARAGEFIPFV